MHIMLQTLLKCSSTSYGGVIMEKVLSDRLIFWIVLIIVAMLISTIIFIRSNNKLAFRDNVGEMIKYFPNRKMTKVFKNGSENEGFTHIVDKVKGGKVQIKQVDLLTRVVMVYDISESDVKLIYTKEVGNNQYQDDYINGLVPNRDDIVIKAPIVVGTKWTDDDEGIYEIIKTDAVVQTPAGDFNAIIVKYTNDDFTVKEYYAEGVGLIKIVVNNYGVYEVQQITE